ncbi:hypothetical protein MIR68_004722 [Amoeboaphelidium protococcarum]|nr:hypothetical protein MIR68_004722 [Amoeboaphelidium protococcarum]KAI3653489.1 hypothetical protein MP228_001436 [Amoeboaphelidium protococcarum]
MTEQSKQVPGLHFVLGGLAACASVTFTNPFEVVKTRLQLQGELIKKSQLSSKTYNSIAHAFIKIGRTEGILALQKGLVPAYFYQVIMNGVRFGGYDLIKDRVQSVIAPQMLQNNQPHFLSNVVSGAMSGMFGAALGSPFFLVKTRLQSASAVNPVGVQHQYRGTADGLRHIIRNEGYRGIFAGAYAAMVRTGVGSSVQLATYDKIKDLIRQHTELKNELAATFGASFGSGLLVCLFMNPFDVIMTRLYNQHNSVKLYHGPMDCFVKTVRAEGFMALYKGFVWLNIIK